MIDSKSSFYLYIQKNAFLEIGKRFFMTFLLIYQKINPRN